MMIKSLAGITPDEARFANMRTPASELRRWIKRLARQRFGEGATLLKIEALMQRAELLSDFRNELLHGLWATELDGEPTLLYHPNAVKPAPTVAQLEQLAADIYALLGEMNQARLDGFIDAALKAHPVKVGA